MLPPSLHYLLAYLTKPISEIAMKRLRKVQAVLDRAGMALGRVVLDEDVSSILDSLQAVNITVKAVPGGMKDPQIAKTVAAGEIVITSNAGDFVFLAMEYELGVIVVDQRILADSKKAAKRISDVIIRFSLWTRPKPWMVRAGFGQAEIVDLTSVRER